MLKLIAPPTHPDIASVDQTQHINQTSLLKSELKSVINSEVFRNRRVSDLDPSYRPVLWFFL